MKLLVTSLLSLMLLNGCSTIFTNAFETEEGVYEIKAHGNVFNSRDAMLEKALKKAEKKCGHANFKQLGDEALGNTRVYNAQIGGYTNSPNVTIRVDCNPEK